jgi:hypothetical protein
LIQVFFEISLQVIHDAWVLEFWVMEWEFHFGQPFEDHWLLVIIKFCQNQITGSADIVQQYILVCVFIGLQCAAIDQLGACEWGLDFGIIS